MAHTMQCINRHLINKDYSLRCSIFYASIVVCIGEVTDKGSVETKPLTLQYELYDTQNHNATA